MPLKLEKSIKSNTKARGSVYQKLLIQCSRQPLGSVHPTAIVLSLIGRTISLQRV